ncbi:pyruvate dehydrogenase complex dihydrolipoyllysine-residue acetyltransferase [Oleiphilus sp. HI0081]|nr:pyruvate dehydrogenase complex dihydrolipoyllysine-residue acetyltransferase [Oleiphilus sp. HI0043]KZY47828.1 pyruvate dehydrogenase complex dihydrolipoyllysine-residue acetyltransferase [Oleiphilus sp. HI0050]KZY55797.1 pyruvate dehydrogenase complex dihydrolipoyllysine-residue acetyltransferase [Oleiphilus sp. HI0061]KZY74033.1 pyruvate dehydrogenase complex dihydrolipoyllysine-residue acetyltransferase [Oleiphilus sp. HI0068]KZY80342.1 pyruvate dehydrogenase complex dihydrolipoyllysine-r
MNSIEVKVPNVGVEGEVEVVEVCVSPGDEIEVDSSLIVLESDKATVEVPSPCAGKVESVSLTVGDKVSEGSLVLVMEPSEGNAQLEESASEEKSPGETPQSELVQVAVPDLGGSESVEVIEVLVEVGDALECDQAMIVLESDKATMEIPCSESGILQTLNIKVGDKVSKGDIIAELKVEGGSSAANANEEISKPSNENKPKPEHDTDAREETIVSEDDAPAVLPQISGSKVHAGPAVRKFAREHGVELSRVKGSGPRSRILKEDLRKYIKSQVQAAQSGNQGGLGLPEIALPDFSIFGEVEIQQMDKLQRLTAKNMQASWLTVPHVTQFDEADITDLEAFRKGHKAQAESRGVKLTPVAFIIKACAYALQQLPQFNVSLDIKNEKIVRKKYIHIGLAVDTPAGLVVPVIRNVDQKSLWDIAQECQSLAAKAKDRKLSPADMQGACFTISSLGGVGGTAFTPIVNTPEVAILGVSKAQMKPVWDGGEAFKPRLMLPLSLSYDHRAVNGADAARFTTLLSQVLGDLRELLL